MRAEVENKNSSWIEKKSNNSFTSLEKVHFLRKGLSKGAKGRNDLSGFTLLETVASMAVLAFIITGTFAIFYQGFRSSKKSKDMVAAVNLARGVLEEYSDWDTLDKLDDGLGACGTDGNVVNATYDWSNPPPCSSYIFPIITLNNVSYASALTISDGPIDGNNLKQLSVTISWTVGGNAKSLTMKTLKAYY